MTEAWAKEETSVDGALARLRWDGVLQYQPRKCGCLLLWTVWTRARFYDGWTADQTWAFDANDALSGVRQPHRCEPEFSNDPIGWTEAQIIRAKVWAGQRLAPTKSIARRFAPVAEGDK